MFKLKLFGKFIEKISANQNCERTQALEEELKLLSKDRFDKVQKQCFLQVSP